MPEIPDFDEIARRWIAEWRTGKGLGEVTLETLCAEQLRLIWHARDAEIEALTLRIDTLENELLETGERD